MLRRILEWKIGIENNFSVSVGKSAKYMNKYLQAEIYQQYLKSYSIAETDDLWNSVFIMCDLFNKISLELSKKSNFTYNMTEAENSLNFLKHVKDLPKNAKEIY